MKEQAEKAFQEMMDISTDLDKAVLFKGDTVLASNFPEAQQAYMIEKAKDLAALGDQQSKQAGSSQLSQLMVETAGGSVFLVLETGDEPMGVLATAKKDSRIGLVFYDMKTCIRDAQETPEEEA
ncbi:MAG: hypothetical protein Kow00129_00540 [Thermoleophilia bacterium]